MDDGQVETDSYGDLTEGDLKEREIATFILCGEIGFKEHITMGVSTGTVYDLHRYHIKKGNCPYVK